MRTFTEEDFKAWGAKGGEARAAKLSPERIKAISDKGIKARKRQAKAAKAKQSKDLPDPPHA